MQSPQTPTDDPFRAHQRKTRKRALTYGIAFVFLALAVGGTLWWRDPKRAVAQARPLLHGLRAQYCNVYEKEAARAPAIVRAPSGAEPTRGLGYYFLDMKVWEHDEHPDENMDTTELAELEALCKGTSRTTGIEFHSQLVKLLAPNAGDGARLDTMRKLLAALGRVKYLFVARVRSFSASVAVGATGLSPGHYAGSAAVYRLSDASLIASVDVDQKAPGFATVYVQQNAYGNALESETARSLNAQTSLAFQDAFERAFDQQGLVLKLR
jgi:hypothetical protein